MYNNFKKLLTDKEKYEKMSEESNPYGDGYVCEKIVKIIENII
ncbi:MAG: hypothetical protein J6A29_04845 [Clostridia bacterium]|nr:hypothetical protein [Clostridia bacterium]